MRAMPKIPWDLAVFLTVTTVGFGYSVQRLVNRDLRPELRLPSEAAELSGDAQGASTVHSSIDLGCLEQRLSRERLSSDQSSVRLRGKFCRMTRQEMKSFEGLRVKNLSNGAEGTIFFHGFDASFVTDAVALKPGRNVIQLEWRANSNSPARSFTAEVVQAN